MRENVLLVIYIIYQLKIKALCPDALCVRVLFFAQIKGEIEMKNKTKNLTLTAMFCALAFTMTAVVRIPVVLFLKYDPKDIIITLCGFILGPLSALAVSVISSLIEMVTISETGVIGCIMNIVSSCSFAFTAALIYKKKKTLAGATIGLISGCAVMTAVMLVWNYCVTPIYMGYPREAVAQLLLPAFLPFNLLKSCLNAAFTFLLYKPVVTALRKTRLIPKSTSKNTKINIPVIIGSVLVIATCVLVILSMNKII